MRKHIFHGVIYVVLLLLMFCGCSSSTANKLEGYWMNEYGKGIAFLENNLAFWYDKNVTYQIYDSNKVIVFDNTTKVANYSFEIKQKVLSLTDLDSGYVTTLYGSDSMQKKIRTEIQKTIESQNQKALDAEQKFLDSVLPHEWEKERNLLEKYRDYCLKQIDNSVNISFNQSEIKAVQDRLDILNTQNKKKICEDAFSMSQKIIRQHVLPEYVPSEIPIDEVAIFLDDGYRCLIKDGQNSVIGYVVEVRLDNGITTPIFDYYAIEFSTRNIYTLDIPSNTWKFIKNLSLPSENE